MEHSSDIRALKSLFSVYQAFPDAITAGWRRFFANLDAEACEYLVQSSSAAETDARDRLIVDQVRCAYMCYGHLFANINPLSMNLRNVPHDFPLLIQECTGLEVDWSMVAQEQLQMMADTYCGSIGYEFMHLYSLKERAWFEDKIENSTFILDPEDQRLLFQQLIQACDFENFLHTRFSGQKRFGLEGGEALIPLLKFFLSKASATNEIVIGMAHRGRLNVLANVVGKPYAQIFAQFNKNKSLIEKDFCGDVKYHQGFRCSSVINGRAVMLTLLPNPSHLEFINPIVMGAVKARQDILFNGNKSAAIGILIHGDAAVAGQGVVSESLNLSYLPDYECGGVIHIIINNQIGFTNVPKKSHAGIYCSDIMKAVGMPVLHVNGDDVDAVIKAVNLAADYRHTFNKDIAVDLICYRKNGHNEIDDPSFTNPLLYQEIGDHPGIKDIYFNVLRAKNIISLQDRIDCENKFRKTLEEHFNAASTVQLEDMGVQNWHNLELSKQIEVCDNTGVTFSILEKIAQSSFYVPNSFHIHQRLQKVLDQRQALLSVKMNIDWPLAEYLALGSLLLQGYGVRFSGQDSSRGTFSQRHCAWVDQTTKEHYVPLNHIQSNQAKLDIIDTPLSESGALGFEYGYSLVDPNVMVIWEAQFGDFANGAQVIIDQFIASGESKWRNQSALVLLLPHGYEGQGSEHSSARIERYLQLSACHNWQVANPSTPANYFHLLRRQMLAHYRKPLIVMTPKSLLRNPLAVSSISQLETSTSFMEVINDQEFLGSKVRRVLLCSGKIYYDLLDYRTRSQIKNIAIVRVEQLYPFPSKSLQMACMQFTDAQFVWCQEEPANMGAWSFVEKKITEILQHLDCACKEVLLVGRCESSCPASGLTHLHNESQKQLMEEAFQ